MRPGDVRSELSITVGPTAVISGLQLGCLNFIQVWFSAFHRQFDGL